MELIADRVTKQYKNKIAVDRMSFTLTRGVTGLLGANGAGKTTLMRLLCGILVPTGGTVTFDGMDVSSEEYRNILLDVAETKWTSYTPTEPIAKRRSKLATFLASRGYESPEIQAMLSEHYTGE